jgi:hypothetical protein
MMLRVWLIPEWQGLHLLAETPKAGDRNRRKATTTTAAMIIPVAGCSLNIGFFIIFCVLKSFVADAKWELSFLSRFVKPGSAFCEAHLEKHKTRSNEPSGSNLSVKCQINGRVMKWLIGS